MTDIGEQPTQSFWGRRSNPKSDWTRVLSFPVLLISLYRHDWKLLGLTVLFVVVNPVLFPKPDPEEVGDSWMYKGVLGEQFWLVHGDKSGYPDVLNRLNVPIFLYGLYSAYRQNPRRTAICTALSAGLKFWFVSEMVRYYEANQAAEAA
ncbi:DUF6653 family protein [Haladaptatus cibarius]|uniref:DUF6653 family protein n=1 Tax=Haladaptatus cibarius TaxID=453847 RepID=UPI000678474E|nr:DUF6653 family protein [Haladaptatus cibarius]